jgi:hypothetical protein
MQLTAKLSQILPTESGMGKNGEWKKQSIIVETEGQYPKKICMTFWGDKFNTAQWQPGLLLAIDFDIESREFNGRWYTDVKAWKIEPAGAVSTEVVSTIPTQQVVSMPEQPIHYDTMPETPPAPAFDDLPF